MNEFYSNERMSIFNFMKRMENLSLKVHFLPIINYVALSFAVFLKIFLIIEAEFYLNLVCFFSLKLFLLGDFTFIL